MTTTPSVSATVYVPGIYSFTSPLPTATSALANTPQNTIPSAADAALIPKLPRSTKHEGLAKGAPQIRWDEQQNAIRHHGKIYFRCATESNSNRKLVVLRPWTQFAINAKTGKVYLTCELCREKTMNKGWAYVPEEGEEKKVV